MDCCLVLVAVICPPIAVIFKSGLCTSDFLINVLLTMIGYIPGLIHSFFIISRPNQRRYRDFDQEGRLYITIAPSECNHQNQQQQSGCSCQNGCQNPGRYDHTQNSQTHSVANYGSVNSEQGASPPAYSVVDTQSQK